MNTDHQPLSTHPPITTTELHRQPPSSTTGNNLSFHTPSPMSPTNLNTNETNSTPEQRLAAAIGRAFLNISPSSFQSATATTANPLPQTFSDVGSSANHTTTTTAATTTTTTPPKVPRNTPLRRTLSDSISSDYDQTKKTGTKNPLRRTLSDTTEYQQPLKTPRVSSSPQSSSGKQSPQSEIMLKKVEDMVREIEQRCWEIKREEEHVEEDIPKPQEQEECVGVERMKDGDLRFELSCCCGKRFEMLIKQNGYCFYRLT